MSAPELPFLGAGAVALIGGVKREGHLPANVWQGVIGTVVLVLVASATAGSKLAPLVRAVGLLLLMASIYGAVRAFQVGGTVKLPAVNTSKLKAVVKATPGNSGASGFTKSAGAGKGAANSGGGGW